MLLPCCSLFLFFYRERSESGTCCRERCGVPVVVRIDNVRTVTARSPLAVSILPAGRSHGAKALPGCHMTAQQGNSLPAGWAV
jgi:hypothetical protein